MPNLRIIYDNAADRATLTAPNAVASLGAANLKTNIKTQVCRSSGKTLEINVAWTTPELVGGVSLPFCNLSPTATMRVRASYSAEPSATNYAKYSEQLDVNTSAAWGRGSSSVTPNATTAPDGASTADKLLDNTSNGAHFIFQNIDGGFVANQQLTFSIFVKAAERNIACIRLDASSTALGGAESNAYLDLTTGAITGITGAFTYKATQFPNGWWRFSATGNTTASGVITPLVMISTSGTSYSFTGTGTSGIYVWGAMLSLGTLSSYYPTTTAAATRPAGYTDSWQTYGYDSGTFIPCPAGAYPAKRTTGVNTFAYGGARCATHWLTSKQTVTGMIITITENDANTPYVDVGRLVIGDYWEPSIGAEHGATFALADNSKHYRTEAGDMLTDVGTRFKKQTFSMPSLNADDRSAMWDILWNNGMSVPMFISMHPRHVNPKLEHTYQLFGKLVTTPIMNTPYFNYNSASVDIEEI